jgi:hypothetical protein
VGGGGFKSEDFQLSRAKRAHVFGQNIERHQHSALGTLFPAFDSARQSLSIKYFDPAESRESEVFLSI